jgi:hypothetical protein
MGWFLLFMTIVISGIGYAFGGQVGGTIALIICLVGLAIWAIVVFWPKNGIDYIKDEEDEMH